MNERTKWVCGIAYVFLYAALFGMLNIAILTEFQINAEFTYALIIIGIIDLIPLVFFGINFVKNVFYPIWILLLITLVKWLYIDYDSNSPLGMAVIVEVSSLVLIIIIVGINEYFKYADTINDADTALFLKFVLAPGTVLMFIFVVLGILAAVKGFDVSSNYKNTIDILNILTVFNYVMTMIFIRIEEKLKQTNTPSNEGRPSRYNTFESNC